MLGRHLKAKGGYVPGASVRGATNDFRVMGVPSALDYEFARLVQLVEDTAAVNTQSFTGLPLFSAISGAMVGTSTADAPYTGKNPPSRIVLSTLYVRMPMLRIK